MVYLFEQMPAYSIFDNYFNWVALTITVTISISLALESTIHDSTEDLDLWLRHG